MKKPCTTYRYVIRVGPTFVDGGITDDLERSKIESLATWPTGQFFQVGDKTSLDQAQEWVTKNHFLPERSSP